MTGAATPHRLAEASALRGTYDLIVVGAGPSGMNAAITASQHGLSVLVVDRGHAEGGQIYRNIAMASEARVQLLGPDYAKGAALVSAFRRAGCDYLPEASVWFLDKTPLVGLSAGGISWVIGCRHVILATGAMERPVPIEGWTLPGVMTAGAAQILLKASGIVAKGRVVIAGSGPLLWLVASQYVKAGVPPALVVDTTPRKNLLRALSSLPDFLRSGLAAKGAALIASVCKSTEVVHGAQLRGIAEKDNRRVLCYRKGGRDAEAEFDHLFLHHGLTPDVNLPSSAGVRLEWDGERAAFESQCDEWGVTNIETISLAGDGAAIAGADSAWHDGAIAALEACRRLGQIDAARRDELARVHRRGQRVAAQGRRFLERLYRPQSTIRRGEGNPVLCRCEEITAGQLRDALERLPIEGPNQWKAFSRCGMGPCQGRQCGLAVSETIAVHLNRTMDSVGYYRLRPPVFPVSLAELAGMEEPPVHSGGNDNR